MKLKIFVLTFAFLIGSLALTWSSANARALNFDSAHPKLTDQGAYRTVDWHGHEHHWRDRDFHRHDRDDYGYYGYYGYPDRDYYGPYTYYSPGFYINTPYFGFSIPLR